MVRASLKTILLMPIFCIAALLPAGNSGGRQSLPLQARLFSESAAERARARSKFLNSITDDSVAGFLLEHPIFSAVHEEVIKQLQMPRCEYAPVYIAEICTDFITMLNRSAYRKYYKLGAFGLTFATNVLNAATPEQLAGAKLARILAHIGIDTLYQYASQRMADADRVSIPITEDRNIRISDFWKFKRRNEELQKHSLDADDFVKNLTALYMEIMTTCDELHAAFRRRR